MDLDVPAEKKEEKKEIDMVKWIVIAMLINFCLSGYLFIQHNASLDGKVAFDDKCFVNDESKDNCADVQSSKHAYLFNIPLSEWGMIAFGFAAILVGAFKRSLRTGKPIEKEDLPFTAKIITWTMVLGACFGIYFIAIQIFLIDAFCKYCIIIDSVSILSCVAWLQHIYIRTKQKDL